jgi:hypothetical protein
MLLFAGFATLATAAVPIELPAGEDVHAWEDALEIGGLVPATAGSGAAVRVQDHGASWTLVVRDQVGAVRTVDVAEPRSAESREEVVWLAVSLLRPMSTSLPPLAAPVAPTAPPAAAPAAERSAGAAIPRPAPTKAPEPPPPPLVEVASTPGAPEASPWTAVSETPPPVPVTTSTRPEIPSPGLEITSPGFEPWPPVPHDDGVAAADHLSAPVEQVVATLETRPPRAWARTGGGVVARGGAGASGRFVVDAGVDAGVIDIGGTVALAPRAGLTELGEERRMLSLDLAAGAWGHATDAGRIGLAVGPSWRRFSEGGEPVSTLLVPVITAEAAMRVPVGGPAIVPFARLDQDLARVDLLVDGAPAGALATRSFTVGLALGDPGWILSGP